MKKQAPENETKKRILLTTLNLISEKGYANVFMRDIASASNVVLSQVTYYFKTKEGLLIEVIKYIKQEYLNKLDEELKNIKNQREKITYIIDFCKNLISENTPSYRLLLDFYSLSMWSEPIGNEFSLFFKSVEEVLCKNISKLKNYPTEQFARILIAATFGISMQYIVDKNNTNIINSLDNIGKIFE